MSETKVTSLGVLMEKMRLNADNKELREKALYIGAESGYIFIGTLQEFDEDFEKISKDCSKELAKRRATINAKITAVNKLIDQENFENDGEKIGRIRKTLDDIEKNLYERRVLETYEKVIDPDNIGTAVIIKGAEAGKYWMRSEYKKAKAKEETK